MSKFEKREFQALDIEGKNYNSWMLDAEHHLNAKGLGDTIKEGTIASTQDNDEAMVFLLCHLHEELRTEYLTFQDPQLVWGSLKERYEDPKTERIRQERHNWLQLSLQNSKSVFDYNFDLLSTTFLLNISGGKKYTEADKIEKTLSTLHPSNADLQTLFRNSGCTTYSNLLNILKEAEQNKTLVLKKD